MSDSHEVRDIIQQASALLLSGKLVAIPTETVYGLGCDATNPEAVRRVFSVKGRPSNNPLILHFDSLTSALPFIALEKGNNPVRMREQLEKLAHHFWPGPLSIIVPRGPGVSDEVCNGGSSIAIRVPHHPLTLEILRTVARPIAAPSANPSTYISPTSALHVQTSLGNKVDLIVDGGHCAVGLESTVLSLLSNTPTILRPGYITAEQISGVLDEAVEYRESKSAETSYTTPLLSPGLMSKHYSPRTTVALISDDQSDSTLPPKRGVILFRERNLPFSFEVKRTLSDSGNLSEVASRLFAALRELDSFQLDVICVDTCESKGLGIAIMDRLIRAAAS